MNSQIRMAVLLGGMVGTVLRFVVVEVVDIRTFPVATLAVNLLGAYLLGRLAGSMPDAPPRIRAFVGTGILGSFTTFSALAVDLVALGTQPLVLLAYAVATIGGGLVLADLGIRQGSGTSRPSTAEGSTR